MDKDKKVIAPFTIPDYRVVRPRIYFEKGSDTMISSQQLTIFTINDCKVSFITPNSVSMLLNKSWKEYEAAERIYTELIKPEMVKGQSFDVPFEDLSKLYDYLEHIQASIITIYSSVEALSNVAIPSDFQLTKKNSKGVKEVWTKENIEQWTPTEEKIGKIVPDILGIENPKHQPFWERFIELKKIRDAIIHQKQSTTNSNEIESFFLKTLFDESIFKKILAGFDLIKYYCRMKDSHTYFPILTDLFRCDVNFIDSFDSALKVAPDGPQMK